MKTGARTPFGESDQPLLWLGLAALIAGLYLYFPNSHTIFATPNELSRIYLTRAVVQDGSFEIDRSVQESGESIDMAFYQGHYYSDKAIGVSLLATPIYALFHTLSAGTLSHRELIPVCRRVVVTLPAIFFLAWLLWRWNDEGALGRTLVLGLAVGTPFFPFALSFYGHTLLAVLLFAIYWRLAESPQETATFRTHVVTGMLCGIAILVDYTAGLFVAFAGLFALVRHRSIPQIAGMAAGALPLLAILAVYNWHAFGHPLDLAYNHMLMENDQVNRSTGFFGIGLPSQEALWGLTFGLARGLFIYSPFMLLLIPALRALIRDRCWQPKDLLATTAIVGYFWLNVSLIDWQGGWTLGPRYLAPIYPFALLLILRGAARESASVRRRYQLFAAATVTWSGLFHLAGVGTWLHSPTAPMRFPVPEVAAYMLRHDVAAENLGQRIGLDGAWSLLPAALLFIAALTASGWDAAKARRSWLAASALGGAVAFLLVTTTAYRTMGDEQIARAQSFTQLVFRSQLDVPTTSP